MTFKHINFEESETMRSLAKLAKDKGLIKEDPLKKVATRKPKLDLRPTKNLSENIMKLCAGLRESGMAKYAEELEYNFILYKKAAIECDSKAVQEAHPNGSHKLDGVHGDAIIETIVDQHLKMMQMVNKKPTGKLTTARSIINAVKVSLGQDDKTALINEISNKLRRVIMIMQKFVEEANKDLVRNIGTKYLSDLLTDPNIQRMRQAKDVIDDLKQAAEPSWYGFGVSESTWMKIQSLPEVSKNLLDDSIVLQKRIDEIDKQNIYNELGIVTNPQPNSQPNSQPTPQPTPQPAQRQFDLPEQEINLNKDKLKQKINDLINKLKSYKSTVNTYQKPEDIITGTDFINEKIGQLSLLDKRLDAKQQNNTEIDDIDDELNVIEYDVKDFYNKWIR